MTDILEYHMKTRFAVLLAGAAMLPAAAFAQTSGMVGTDLNLREGPGTNYATISTMPANADITIDGCIEGQKWCQVTYNGQTGWAYSDYLMATTEGQTVVVTERPQLVPAVGFDSNTTAGVAGGAVIGALVGGPIGAAVGAGAGALAANIQPTAGVVDFVNQNPLDPVYLDGEVVVGAGIPQNVEVYQVPQSDYSYANINGETVLVQPDTRKIVYVYR